jgi:hypothetical protein
MPRSLSPSIARDIEPLLRTRKARVSVKDVLERVEGHDGLAPVVFVLTLPILLPLPPGLSMVMALPLLMAAPQMMIGRRDLWLPDRLSRQDMSREKMHATVKRVLPWLLRLEKVVHPRLTFLTGRIGAGVAGAVCTLMAIVLVLPIPFANVLPALTVLLLSLGLARRDGLAILIGVLLLAAAITGVVWGLHGARLGLHHLFKF